ncbi:unnamed protein product [Leptidea sinapis]|uniref:T-box domain-containing protein n=1 Tax=Leptidea sinapis TaxID=189913 RepID=A0A5E4Q4C6_9NEOP|nr:unnamed protein product [Leptidea sinapis]
MDVEAWSSAKMVSEEGKTRATDFSIAAIMARSGEQPRSPLPTARSPTFIELGERDTPSPARPLTTPVTSCNCEELLSVDCQLETKELWDKFHDLGTEMIITKTGR